MKIILIRHFRVDYAWKILYNSFEFEKSCKDYDEAGIINHGITIKTDYKIITSTMNRAIETSKLIFNKTADYSDDAMCEVPIKPFMTLSLKLPRIIWEIFGRLQWRLNIIKQPETYLESKIRVYRFLNNLIASNENCIIVSHGWTIKLIIKQLKISGFAEPRPIFIKNGKPYEYFR
jgi:broad specificity phosphatase PhoE